ncbi:protein-tyrosine phosphatase-like protein [Mycena belliarum]|uniref:Protein-tyrosine phosphatase-like protein n=1 Tax=Mycena belliarum TaxID=1033014 RepID=A0AAD6TTM9_9AGAR|nr:protein-tyrosine phosphatase-like protein [Mycena belliae]
MTTPPWLSRSRSASHHKHVQRTLQQRESRRAFIRYLYLKELAPPKSISRQLLDHYSIAIGCNPDNGNKNRYGDIMPYDRTLVVVDPLGTQRYLNASWCLEQFGRKWWIASQATLPATAHAFLSLIRQPITLPGTTQTTQGRSQQPNRVKTVVQLTQIVEGGRRKAHSYFPTKVGRSIVHYPEPGSSATALRVTLLQVVDIADACCVKSTVSVTEENREEDPVTFQHLLYTAWPDRGVPEPDDQKSLIAFLRLVDTTNRPAPGDPDLPAIVGCSAGIGRTGTFIAISSLLRHEGYLTAAASPHSSQSVSSPPLGPLPSAFDEDLVAREVDSLREQRPGMVQQASQLELIYSLLEAALV